MFCRHLVAFAAAFTLIALQATAALAGDALKEMLDQARKLKVEGIAELNLARKGGADETARSRNALKIFEKAQALYETYLEKAGENEKIEDEMSELQSLMYWCKKMTPLAGDEAPAEPAEPPDSEEWDDEDPAAAKPPEPKKPEEPAKPAEPAANPEQEAERLYNEADRFAAECPDEHIQILARFFRVADQFRGTTWAAKALEKAIQFQKGFAAKESGRSTAAPDKPGQEKPLAVSSADPTLIRLQMRSPDPAVRSGAIDLLVGLLGKNSIPDLHDIFLAEEDRVVRDTVYKHLVAMKDKKTLDSFKAFAASRNRSANEDLIRLIAEIGQEKHYRYMLYVILYNDVSLAAPYPARSGTDLDSYMNQVENAYGSGLRRLVVETIKKLGDKGYKGIEDLFSTRGAAVREAILALGMTGNVKSFKKIVIYMARGRAGVYRAEAMAMFKHVGFDTIPYLIAALNNSSTKIWSSWLLRDMTGQPYAGNPDKWTAWYKANRKK